MALREQELKARKHCTSKRLEDIVGVELLST